MSIFDRIGASMPVNKQAALSSAASRDAKSSKKINAADSQIPTPTVRVPSIAEDLTGRVVGRLTVIGLDAAKRNSKGLLWLVRCACSTFTKRRSKALKNPANSEDRCDQCRHSAFLTRTSQLRTVGQRVNTKFHKETIVNRAARRGNAA